MNLLEYWDKSATLWINGFNSPWSDRLWLFMSDKEVWIPLYILVIALLFFRLGWKKALVAILCIVLTVAACDQFANLIKDLAARLRPNKDQWMIDRGLHILEKGGKYGFFSAHAANSFGLAVSSCAFLNHRLWPGETLKAPVLRKVYAPVIMVWAFLVSLSRIFVAKHFLGDVIVGVAVGILLGWAISRVGIILYLKAGLQPDCPRQ